MEKINEGRTTQEDPPPGENRFGLDSGTPQGAILLALTKANRNGNLSYLNDDVEFWLISSLISACPLVEA